MSDGWLVSPRRGALSGIGLKIAATFGFGLMNVIIKYLGHIPIGEIVFFRSLFALLPVFAIAALSGHLSRAFRTNRPQVHVVRALTGTAAMFCYFASITTLPLADSTALSFVMPVFSVVLAALVLREAVGPYRWGAVLVGFLGVLVMIEPHGGVGGLVAGGLRLGVVLGLIGAFLAAFVVVFIRQMSQTETSEAIVFYFMVTASLASGATLFFDAVWPTPWETALLIMAGLLGGLAQVAMTYSYRFAEPSLLAPFDYVAIIWAVSFGFIVFSEIPGAEVLSGAAIIVAAGIFIAWRERRRGLQKAKPQSL